MDLSNREEIRDASRYVDKKNGVLGIYDATKSHRSDKKANVLKNRPTVSQKSSLNSEAFKAALVKCKSRST